MVSGDNHFVRMRDLFLGVAFVVWGTGVYRLRKACGHTWEVLPYHAGREGEEVTITNTIGPIFEARQGARDAMAVWATDVETAQEEMSRWNELSLYAAQQATRIVVEEYEADNAI